MKLSCCLLKLFVNLIVIITWHVTCVKPIEYRVYDSSVYEYCSRLIVIYNIRRFYCCSNWMTLHIINNIMQALESYDTFLCCKICSFWNSGILPNAASIAWTWLFVFYLLFGLPLRTWGAIETRNHLPGRARRAWVNRNSENLSAAYTPYLSTVGQAKALLLVALTHPCPIHHWVFSTKLIFILEGQGTEPQGPAETIDILRPSWMQSPVSKQSLACGVGRANLQQTAARLGRVAYGINTCINCILPPKIARPFRCHFSSASDADPPYKPIAVFDVPLPFVSSRPIATQRKHLKAVGNWGGIALQTFSNDGVLQVWTRSRSCSHRVSGYRRGCSSWFDGSQLWVQELVSWGCYTAILVTRVESQS